MNKNSRIFIAGHNGLVGSAVHRNLQLRGYKNLLVISRKELDLKESKKVELYFEKSKIKYLVICAALAGGILANQNKPVQFFNENILIQNSLLNAALKFKLRRTVFLGTSCIYPQNSITPIKEDYLLTGSLHKTNQAYAIAKISGIKLSEAMYNQYNLDIVALMPTNIYGINDRYEDGFSHVIPALIMKFLKAKNNNKKFVEIWGDGRAKREFLFSDDLANAIHLILKTPKKKLFKLCGNNFPVINVGSGDIYSIKELADVIAKKINYKGKIIYNINYPNGVMKKDLESSKLNTLGWKPKVRLEQGLEIILKNIKRDSWK
jgi:GDP-L-fucose synthase